MESPPETRVPEEWVHIEGKLHRLRIGEIFQFSDNSTSMTCINCSQEFQYFTEFSLHIQEHFMRGEIAPLKEITKGVVADLPSAEDEADDTDSKAAVLKMRVDGAAEDSDDDGQDDRDERPDDSTAMLPEMNCEVVENEDCDDFGLDAGGWSDDDFDVNSHSIFGCEPNVNSAAEKQEKEKENQQQQIQFVDGTDYQKNCNDQFKCLTCDHEGDKWKEFKEHLTAHLNPAQIKCPICLRVFSSVSYVRTHCSQAHNVRMSSNQIKDAQSSSTPVDIATLEQPKEVEPKYKEGIDYEKVDQKFQCITCRRVMAKLDHMKEHLLTHNTEKNVHCPMCDKVFITESYVRKHVNRAHKKRITAEEIRAAQPAQPTGDSKPVTSEIASTIEEEAEQQQQRVGEAGKTFVEGEDYEKSNGRFKCLTCGRKILDHIREHLQTHSNEKNVYCPLCNKAFIAVSYVRKHVNRAHKKKITAEEIKKAQGTIDTSNKNDDSKDVIRTRRKTQITTYASNDDDDDEDVIRTRRRKTIKTATVPTETQKNFECFHCHRLFHCHRRQKCLDPSCQKTFPVRRYMLNHYRTIHLQQGKRKKSKSNKMPPDNSEWSGDKLEWTGDDADDDDVTFFE